MAGTEEGEQGPSPEASQVQPGRRREGDAELEEGAREGERRDKTTCDGQLVFFSFEIIFFLYSDYPLILNALF